MNQDTLHNSRWSMAGGIILSIAPNITSQEILHTAILAAIGATVSYLVSMLLRKYIK